MVKIGAAGGFTTSLSQVTRIIEPATPVPVAVAYQRDAECTGGSCKGSALGSPLTVIVSIEVHAAVVAWVGAEHCGRVDGHAQGA